MVSVFHKYVFLCLLTTSVLYYFLKVSHVHAVETPCDLEASFFKCSDGKRHTIQNKTYHLKSSWEVFSMPVSLYVEGNGALSLRYLMLLF